jgi:FMN reductase
MKILIISCSLNPGSRSRVLAGEAARPVGALGAEVTLLDLREFPMPMCDGEECDVNLARLGRSLREANAILLAVPIYNR